MTTLELEERNLTIQIPSHWDEMTPDQIFFALHVILQPNSPFEGGRKGKSGGQGDVTTAQIKIFYNLANIKRSWRTILWEKMMPADQVFQKNANASQLALHCTSFLFTNRHPEGRSVDQTEGSNLQLATSGLQLELNYNTILNHFPKILSAKSNVLSSKFYLLNSFVYRLASSCCLLNPKYLYGPAHLLSDLTYGEFRAALEELNDYFDLVRESKAIPPLKGGAKGKSAGRGMSKESQHQLARFLATLYRPQRKNYKAHSRSETFDGNRREPFNRNLIEKNARYTRHMHPIHQQAVLLWFTYTIHYIQTEELTISGRTISLKQIFKKPPKNPPSEEDVKGKSQNAWTSILYTIAKDGVFGSAEATDKVGLFDILLYLYDQHMENQRLKAKYPKSKNS